MPQAETCQAVESANNPSASAGGKKIVGPAKPESRGAAKIDSGFRRNDVSAQRIPYKEAIAKDSLEIAL